MDKFIADLLNQSAKLIVDYAPRLVGAILMFWIGSWLIGRLVKIIRKISGKREWDPTLRNFIVDLANVGLKIMLLVSVASMLGFETTSFVAVLGAAGLAVGLALQGSLSNFAGGVLILLFRPFRVGDLIEAGGSKGFVTSINIFVTTLLTDDNRVIILPNGPLANGSVVNYSTHGFVRVDVPVMIDNGIHFSAIRPTVLEVLKRQPLAILDKGVDAVIVHHDVVHYTFFAQAHCRPEDIIPLKGAIAGQLNEALAEHLRPMPQIMVHQG